MIKKWKKKPVVVEAIQYTGLNRIECLTFIGPNFDEDLSYPNVQTLEGNMKVSVGDYIIRGVKGEYYPCKPDVFASSYEEVL